MINAAALNSMERDISKEATEASPGRFRFHKKSRVIRSTLLIKVGFLKSVQNPKKPRKEKFESGWNSMPLYLTSWNFRGIRAIMNL